jgi:hypothetical protein
MMSPSVTAPPGFWRTLGNTVAKNPISLFAVLCVACTAAFLGYMTNRMATVLESAKWCSTAINAEKITAGETFVGLTTCVDLLKIQLQAMATGFHIAVGAFAFSLIVLIVIVVAGARASGKIGSGGVEFDVDKQKAVEDAADHVAEGAEQARDEVKGG